MRKMFVLIVLTLTFLLSACTQETQNRIGKDIQNWTGTNGVLDIYMNGKLIKRFIKVDKLTTATAKDGVTSRNYRYGYGYLDKNFNFKRDEGEKKLYFEVSNFSTPYIFYENPEN